MNCTRNFLEAMNDDQELQKYLKEISNNLNKSKYKLIIYYLRFIRIK